MSDVLYIDNCRLKKGAIYKITFHNNLVYIGQTKNEIGTRIQAHIDNPSPKLQLAFEQSNWEFTVECLKDGLNKFQLDFFEKHYIVLNNSADENFGYNATVGNLYTKGNGKEEKAPLTLKTGVKRTVLVLINTAKNLLNIAKDGLK